MHLPCKQTVGGSNPPSGFMIMTERGTPYIGFGSDTVESQPMLGPTAPCPKCGKECEIKDGVPAGFLQFISCCESSFLVGIKGKDITGVKSDVSGEI